MTTALVCGAGGFIGSHLVKRLKGEGFWVRGVDLKYPEFSKTQSDEFVIGDLKYSHKEETAKKKVEDERYTKPQLMAYAGIFTALANPAEAMGLNVEDWKPLSGFEEEADPERAYFQHAIRSMATPELRALTEGEAKTVDEKSSRWFDAIRISSECYRPYPSNCRSTHAAAARGAVLSKIPQAG